MPEKKQKNTLLTPSYEQESKSMSKISDWHNLMFGLTSNMPQA